jgi:hypothetical protein
MRSQKPSIARRGGGEILRATTSCIFAQQGVGGIGVVCPRALSAPNPERAEILPTLNSLEEVFGAMENSTGALLDEPA